MKAVMINVDIERQKSSILSILSDLTISGSLNLSDVMWYDVGLALRNVAGNQIGLETRVKNMIGKSLLRLSAGRTIFLYLVSKYAASRAIEVFYLPLNEQGNNNEFILFLSHSKQHSKLIIPYIKKLINRRYSVLLVTVLTNVKNGILSLPGNLAESSDKLLKNASRQFENFDYDIDDICTVLNSMLSTNKTLKMDDDTIKKALYGKLVWKIVVVDLMLQLLENVLKLLARPKTVVLLNDQQAFGRAASLYAARHAIPTILLQHGIIASEPAPAFFEGISASHIGVWGEMSRKLVTEKTGKPVSVIGSAFYKEWHGHYNKYYNCNNRNGDSINILLLLHPYNQTINQKFIDLAISLQGQKIGNQKIKCAVKIHHRAATIVRNLLTIKRNRIELINEKKELLAVLRDYDLVITYPSTGVLDACIANRIPLIYSSEPDDCKYLSGLQQLIFSDIDNLVEYLYALCNSQVEKRLLNERLRDYLRENLDLDIDPYEELIKLLEGVG